MICSLKDKTTVLYSYQNTICPRSSDPFNVVTYYIQRVTNSWTHSSCIFNFKSWTSDSPRNTAILSRNLSKLLYYESG